MNYNQNIHHRRSIRLKGYDYSQAGAYFITICCQEKEVSTFGEIVDGKMILNAYGTIAYNEWGNTPNVRNNVELDVFVIMPNHIHGIIILNDNPRRDELQSQNYCRGELHSPNLKVEFENLKGEFDSPRQGFVSPKGTVGSIVRGFKSSVTKQINTYNRTVESNSTNPRRGELHSPSDNTVSGNKKGECNSPLRIWQRDYYEHIIRNDKSYQRISDYINNNPANWTVDKFGDLPNGRQVLRYSDLPNGRQVW